jgi:hypothetical protein
VDVDVGGGDDDDEIAYVLVVPVIGVKCAYVRLSTTVANAGVPCTTACSPANIILPGADVVNELNNIFLNMNPQ